MNKRLKLTLWACCFSFTIILAQEFKYGDFYYTPINSSEVKLVKKESYWQMNMTTLSIPENVSNGGITYKVAEIEARAFFSGSIRTLFLPQSMKKLGEQAFGLQILNEVTCYAITPPLCEGNSYNRVFCTLKTLYVPEGTGSSYANSNGWSDANNIVEIGMNYYYLTIRYHGGGVSVKQRVDLGKTYTFKLEPSPGKRIACVLYNNTDVTSNLENGYFTTPEIIGNSILDVVFLNQ